MSPLATFFRVLVAVAMCTLACGALADRNDAPEDATHTEREVLLMLRLPPPHFRPDASYLGSYDTQFGRVARQRIAADLAARYRLKIVDSWPMSSLGVDCFVMRAAADVAIGPLVEEMALDSRIESVQSMNLFHLLSRDDPLYRLQPAQRLWHLDDIHRLATGKNVRVAEIDSGVELDHPDLRGRVAIARNFVDARDAVAETHGTAVAGIIAARADNGVGIVGVAPDAALMALRACWQTPADENSAVCSSFTLAKALQFALDKKRKGDQSEPRRTSRSAPRAPSGDRPGAWCRGRRRGGSACCGPRLPGIVSRRACRCRGGRAGFVRGDSPGAGAGHPDHASRPALGLRRGPFVRRCARCGPRRVVVRNRSGPGTTTDRRNPASVRNVGFIAAPPYDRRCL